MSKPWSYIKAGQRRGPLGAQPLKELSADHFPLTPGQQIDYWYTLLDPPAPATLIHRWERELWHPGGQVSVRIPKVLVQRAGPEAKDEG
jgi:hypothetical protein